MDPERTDKEIARIRDDALRVAFTLPHKPQKAATKKPKPKKRPAKAQP
jgi:hypothetical protein